MGYDKKIMLQRKKYNMTTVEELMGQAKEFISFMPGVTEILFYYVLLAVVKPFLVSQRIYPNFMLAVIGPSGHLKTTLVRLFALWLEHDNLQEMAFADVTGQSALDARIKELQGMNLIMDDMHAFSGNYRRNKQTELLDYLSRHCDSRNGLANIIVTGEMVPPEAIFSTRDRMLQLQIPQMSAEELKAYKHKIGKLPENFMAQLSERFAETLEMSRSKVECDIGLFHEKYEEPAGLDSTTRIAAHVEYILITQFLYKKYFCANNESASMEKQFKEALHRQALRLHNQLCNQRQKEEEVDYVEVVYEILSCNKYLTMESVYGEYKPSADNFVLHNGKFYITKTALQKGLLTYLKRTVSMKAVSDALHDAGVIEEDCSARTKKFQGTRHYVISRQAIELYCRTKENFEI